MRKTVPVLLTPRLRLRPYTAADQGWFVDTLSDPVVMKHVGGPLSEEAAKSLFVGIIDGTAHGERIGPLHGAHIRVT